MRCISLGLTLWEDILFSSATRKQIDTCEIQRWQKPMTFESIIDEMHSFKFPLTLGLKIQDFRELQIEGCHSIDNFIL